MAKIRIYLNKESSQDRGWKKRQKRKDPEQAERDGIQIIKRGLSLGKKEEHISH